MVWEIKQISKAKLRDPVLIEGLPGMGNVGKIAVDFLIDALNAKKLFELSSYDLPHCVFVNEENMVELPSINIYYKNVKDRTLLFLAGDIQPINERSCYEFCDVILDTFKKDSLKEIITLGGIALPKIPSEPKVYCTGNDKKIISKYKSNLVNTQIHGVVGPIVGVSGLLPGLAAKKEIPAIALLAETFGHPNYLGIKGARNILKILSKQLRLNIDLSELDSEISEIEKEFASKSKNINKITNILKKKVNQLPSPEDDEEGLSYIG
ncbi:MAG: PAC2 family protein [Nanoarchaeota archaeon]